MVARAATAFGVESYFDSNPRVSLRSTRGYQAVKPSGSWGSWGSCQCDFAFTMESRIFLFHKTTGNYTTSPYEISPTMLLQTRKLPTPVSRREASY